MNESTKVPLSSSLAVRLEVVEDDRLLPYYVNLTLNIDGQTIILDRPLRLDMMYEQVQTLVDNHLRQMTGKLSAAMRAQRKQTLK